MSGLKRRIAAQIAVAGPISVADYFAMCLFDPQDGYYVTREPFGAGGDFVTAPEVSQMFGELVAVWLVSAWRAAGEPDDAVLIEIGPGRGTLMADLLRAAARLAPRFVERARIAMVEASPRLTAMQKETLRASPARPSWHARLEEVEAGFQLLVANELFDALPCRQFVRTPAGWRERMVTLAEDGELAFAVGASGLDPALLPPGADDQPEGAVFEPAPARTALMEEIAARIARDGGAALFFDYGHLEAGFADTLQAVRAHRFDGVLENPGEADLTSHVDFAALARVATQAGLNVAVAEQGDFLLAMGLAERAGSLGAAGDEALRRKLSGEVERLAAPDRMGSLFKVMAASSLALPLPPFTQAD